MKKLNEEFLKDTDIQKIAEKGIKIYKRLKRRFEPRKNGKFLAIEVDSGQVYLGKTSAEAMKLANENHPGKFFYVIKIGFSVSETLAKSFINSHPIT